MKKLVIAAAILAATAVSASAQRAPEWRQGGYPYARQHHAVCQEKAHRLYSYERRAAKDGRISRKERDIIRSLQHDLDRTCGRYRFRG